MKIYLATSETKINEADLLTEILQARGHEVVGVVGNGDADLAGPEANQHELSEMLQELSECELMLFIPSGVAETWMLAGFAVGRLMRVVGLWNDEAKMAGSGIMADRMVVWCNTYQRMLALVEDFWGEIVEKGAGR